MVCTYCYSVLWVTDTCAQSTGLVSELNILKYTSHSLTNFSLWMLNPFNRVQECFLPVYWPFVYVQSWNDTQLYKVHWVDVIILCNSGVIGGIISYKKEQFAANISFNEFHECVSAHMGVSPADVSIGFCFQHNSNVISQRPTTHYEELQTKAKFCEVISTMVKKLCHACTHHVILELYNM